VAESQVFSTVSSLTFLSAEVHHHKQGQKRKMEKA